MCHADAFAALTAIVLVEGDDAMPVLKPDGARGPEARRGKAHQVIKEDAANRIDPASWHKLKLRLANHLCGITTPQAIAATTYARGRGKSDTWSLNLRLKSA
jgi:hypothetical protein